MRRARPNNVRELANAAKQSFCIWRAAALAETVNPQLLLQEPTLDRRVENMSGNLLPKH